MICVVRRISAVDRAGETVAELRGVAGNHPAAIAGVGGGERTPVRGGRAAIEIEERLREAESKARPLDEGAVGAEGVAGVVGARAVGAQTDCEIAAHAAVFGLAARVRRDIAPRAPDAVVGRAIVDVCVRPAPGEIAVGAIGIFGADPPADLDAHVGAWNVIKSHTVQAADFDVVDRFCLKRQIGPLRACNRNQPRRRAKQKALPHHHF
jgi:hypothetical protein